MSVNFFSVNDHFLYALFHMVGILDADVINAFSVCAGQLKISEIIGDAGIYAQAAQGGIYAQNILGNIREGPCRSTCLPVSQLFLPSPKFGASGPATIWE